MAFCALLGLIQPNVPFEATGGRKWKTLYLLRIFFKKVISPKLPFLPCSAKFFEASRTFEFVEFANRVGSDEFELQVWLLSNLNLPSGKQDPRAMSAFPWCSVAN